MQTNGDEVTVVVAQQLLRSWPMSLYNLLAAVAVASTFRGAVPDRLLLAGTGAFVAYSVAARSSTLESHVMSLPRHSSAPRLAPAYGARAPPVC
jgi:hypothetical protein